jgi:light-regulated signal transduction histidine kinase (bacteriophytochrome)
MAYPKEEDQLLINIVEHLKLPLTNIALKSEIANLTDIKSLADNSIRLIDGFVLGLNLAQNELQLEPVSVSEVLSDAAHALSKTARIYDCNLNLKIEGRFAPVMSSKSEMQSALTLIGQTVIESNLDRNSEVFISAYRSGDKIIAGVFKSGLKITNESLRKSIISAGQVLQGLPDFSHSSVAGIYTADLLLSKLSSKLQVFHHNNLEGLAGNFIPSQQLSLV